MGIYGQPNSWQCGPFALKHALLALGTFAHEEELTRQAGSTEEGTDEIELARAARAHGCDVGNIRHGTPWAARRALARWLGQGVPVLLCLDQWNHWVTAVAQDRDDVVLFDSHYDHPVLRIEPWDRVAQRLAYRAPARFGLLRGPLYDLHPVVPRAADRPRLRLTALRARQLLAWDMGDLARTFDRYAARLLPLTAPNGSGRGTAPLARFLRDSGPAILERAGGASGTTMAARELERLAFVAELYELGLAAGGERETATRIAEALTHEAPLSPRASPPRASVAPDQ